MICRRLKMEIIFCILVICSVIWNVQGYPQNDPNSRIKMMCGVKRILYKSPMSHKAGSWPWHAAIYRQEDEDDEMGFSCGGTLINKNTIITSGSCLTSSNGQEIPPQNFKVYLGKDQMDTNEKWTTENDVSEVIRHPNFKGNEMEVITNDVGILKLSSEVTFNSYIQPICLPKIDTRLFGKNGITVGWGSDESGELSNNLKVMPMPIVSNQECMAKNTQYMNMLTPTNLCTGSREGSVPCNGDSGGGLYLLENGYWTLRGVLSKLIATESEGSCSKDDYIVYENIWKFIPFIKKAE